MTNAFSYARRWQAAIASALLTVIAVNIYLVVVSVRSDPGALEKQPYERGLTYESVIEAKRAFSRFGWTATTQIVKHESSTSVVLKVIDTENTPVRHLTGTLKLLRPSDSRADRLLALEPAEDGSYHAVVSNLPAGLWLAYFELQHGEQALYFEDSLIVP